MSYALSHDIDAQLLHMHKLLWVSHFPPLLMPTEVPQHAPMPPTHSHTLVIASDHPTAELAYVYQPWDHPQEGPSKLISTVPLE